MAKKYVLSADTLLGFVLKVDFNETHFITCDAWKRKCGGVPRGSFILFRIDPRSVDPEDAVFTERLILARIQDSAPTPVESNIQQTLFQVHKLQAQPDPITAKEFQWGALKASIVGTLERPERLLNAAMDAYHRGALVVVSNALCRELETLYAEAGILRLMRPKELGPDRKPQNVEESAFVLDPLRRWSEWKKVGKLILPKKRPGKLSISTQTNIQIAAQNPDNGKVRPEGRPRKLGSDPSFSRSKTQGERAQENGIDVRTQRNLDKIARIRPDLLPQISSGELSIRKALKLCEQPQEKIQKNPSVDQLKRIFSNLSEEEKDQFQEWIVFNRSSLKEIRLIRQ